MFLSNTALYQTVKLRISTCVVVLMGSNYHKLSGTVWIKRGLTFKYKQCKIISTHITMTYTAYIKCAFDVSQLLMFGEVNIMSYQPEISKRCTTNST